MTGHRRVTRSARVGGARPLVDAACPARAAPPRSGPVAGRDAIRVRVGRQAARPPLRTRCRACPTPAHAGYWRREAEVALRPAVRRAGPASWHRRPFGAGRGGRPGSSPSGARQAVWRAAARAVRGPGARPLRPCPACAGPDRAAARRRLRHDRLALAEEPRRLADPGAHAPGRRRRPARGSAAGTGWTRLRRGARQAGCTATRCRPTSWPPVTTTSSTVDWQCFGTGPVGSDLGYYALSSREEFDVLLEAFLAGVADDADVESIRLAAQVTAVYSVITRAEWALVEAARGEGALAGKFRHPAVAPYIRDLQRQSVQRPAQSGDRSQSSRLRDRRRRRRPGRATARHHVGREHRRSGSSPHRVGTRSSEASLTCSSAGGCVTITRPPDLGRFRR